MFACASQRKIASATLRQDGFLRADAGEPWMLFTATERFVLDPLAFRWDAAVCRGFLRINVRDKYANGRGCSSARLLGLIPLGSQNGTPQANEASLVRMLAESPWIPPLLRDERIAWEECGPDALRATLCDRGICASATMTFAANGEIVAVEALRYRDVRGTPVLTPWRGRFEDYEPMDGMMLPRTAKVEWIGPEGAVEVWRGRITDASFEYEPGIQFARRK